MSWEDLLEMRIPGLGLRPSESEVLGVDETQQFGFYKSLTRIMLGFENHCFNNSLINS